MVVSFWIKNSQSDKQKVFIIYLIWFLCFIFYSNFAYRKFVRELLSYHYHDTQNKAIICRCMVQIGTQQIVNQPISHKISRHFLSQKASAFVMSLIKYRCIFSHDSNIIFSLFGWYVVRYLQQNKVVCQQKPSFVYIPTF